MLYVKRQDHRRLLAKVVPAVDLHEQVLNLFGAVHRPRIQKAVEVILLLFGTCLASTQDGLGDVAINFDER